MPTSDCLKLTKNEAYIQYLVGKLASMVDDLKHGLVF